MGVLQCFKVNVDETFTEVKTESALKEKLNAEECYIIVSDKYRKVYLWRGFKSTVRSKFIGARVCVDIRKQLGVDFSLVALDEGAEHSDFLKLIGGITEGGIEARFERDIKRDERIDPSIHPGGNSHGWIVPGTRRRKKFYIP